MKNLFTLKRWAALWAARADFASGLWTTLRVSFLGLCFALFLGIVFGLLSTSKNKTARGLARTYVEFFQNTPLYIQTFFFYNGLPYFGVILSPFIIGILAIGLYHGAYIAEVIRTGILGIPNGQKEAARSQGFTYLQSMYYVILPQTLKIILPPLANQALNLVKNTSVLAMIAGGDLMYHSDSWATLYDYHAQGYIAAGLLYFILCFPLAKLAAYMEKRAKIIPGSIQVQNAEAAEV